MAGKKKKPPAAPEPLPPPTIDEAKKQRDEADAQLRRRGRAAYLLTGYRGVDPNSGQPYKSLLGGA